MEMNWAEIVDNL